MWASSRFAARISPSRSFTVGSFTVGSFAAEVLVAAVPLLFSSGLEDEVVESESEKIPTRSVPAVSAVPWSFSSGLEVAALPWLLIFSYFAYAGAYLSMYWLSGETPAPFPPRKFELDDDSLE